MVDELDADTLAHWQAVAAIDGWGCDYERTAMLCSAIHNAVMVASAKQGGSVDERDFRNIEDFVPKFVFERKKVKTQSTEEMIALAKSIAGVR